MITGIAIAVVVVVEMMMIDCDEYRYGTIFEYLVL